MDSDGNIVETNNFIVQPECILVYDPRKMKAVMSSALSMEVDFKSDLYSSMRPFLVIGKLIGLVPAEGVCQGGIQYLKFRKLSIPTFVNLLLTLVMAINSTVSLVGLSMGNMSDAGDYAWSISDAIYYATSVYLRLFFFCYSNELLQIFKEWNQMTLYFTREDPSLAYDIKLLSGIVMTSAILENTVGHLRLFPIAAASWEIAHFKGMMTYEEPVNGSAWETYYARSHCQWAQVVPYSMPVAIFVFISNKLAFYAWNYMDLLIVILARAIYFKFKVLYLEAEARIFKSLRILDANSWRQLARDHQVLCDMLKLINNFISPLILLSYGQNIYFICIQMHLGLTQSENTSLISSVYAVWSFLHLIARVFLINEAGARIHLWAHKVLELIRKCPNEVYIMETERMERFVASNTITLNGSGCFSLTKPLILRVIGIVFTFEVVLLQAHQSPFLSFVNNNNKTMRT